VRDIDTCHSKSFAPNVVTGKSLGLRGVTLKHCSEAGAGQTMNGQHIVNNADTFLLTRNCRI